MSQFHAGSRAAPSSVGGLMEPSFLRDVACDAHGERRAAELHPQFGPVWKAMTAWAAARLLRTR